MKLSSPPPSSYFVMLCTVVKRVVIIQCYCTTGLKLNEKFDKYSILKDKILKIMDGLIPKLGWKLITSKLSHTKVQNYLNQIFYNLYHSVCPQWKLGNKVEPDGFTLNLQTFEPHLYRWIMIIIYPRKHQKGNKNESFRLIWKIIYHHPHYSNHCAVQHFLQSSK